MQDAVEKRNVASGFDWQKEVAGAGNRRDARVDDDDFRAAFARLPDIVGRNRRAFGDVRAADPDDLRAQDIAPWVCRAVNAEGLLIARRRADHTEPPVVINVWRFQ